MGEMREIDRDETKRAAYLMRVAAKALAKYAPSARIEYDEAMCDGLCLADDLKLQANELHDDAPDEQRR